MTKEDHREGFLPERMRSSMISASPRNAAACSGVRFSESCRNIQEKKNMTEQAGDAVSRSEPLNQKKLKGQKICQILTFDP